MHRIVIDLYDHTSDDDAREFAREIVERFQPSNAVRVERDVARPGCDDDTHVTYDSTVDEHATA